MKKIKVTLPEMETVEQRYDIDEYVNDIYNDTINLIEDVVYDGTVKDEDIREFSHVVVNELIERLKKYGGLNEKI